MTGPLRAHPSSALCAPQPARVGRRGFLAGVGATLAFSTLPPRTVFGGPLTEQSTSAGRLVVAQGADPAGLHPLLETGLVEASTYGNVYDSLVALDADGRLVPSLAESWEQRDEVAWTFHLRPDVTFHNGEPFDSTSVRFTVEQVLDTANRSPIRSQLDAIDRVETPDDRTAVIVTRRPFAPLIAELTQLMMVPPLHTRLVGFAELGEQPVGTGPFRFVERVRDDRLVLGANGQHWRGPPGIRQVEFRPFPETATRLASVRTGQADLATNVPVELAAVLEREGLRVMGRPGVQALYVRLHARKPPLDDIRVRQAIVHAVDVDQLIATIYGGRARRINGPYPPDVFAYDAEASLPTYDPDLARALLHEAGVPAGTPLIFETPQGRYPKDDQVAVALADFLERVGLRVQVRVVEWGTYLKKLQAGEGEHLFLLAGTNRTFDPHFTIARLYGNGGAFGRAYYGNRDIDPLAAEAAAELDPERRQSLYGHILATLRADVPALGLAQLDDLDAIRPTLEWQPRADSLLWLDGTSFTA